MRPARRDRHTGDVSGCQRHVHGTHLHRLVVRHAVQDHRALEPPYRPPRPPWARSSHRCRGAVQPLRRASLRQDPPGQRGHAGRDDSPTRRLGQSHATRHDRRPARRLVRASGDDPAIERAIGGGAKRSRRRATELRRRGVTGVSTRGAPPARPDGDGTLPAAHVSENDARSVLLRVTDTGSSNR